MRWRIGFVVELLYLVAGAALLIGGAELFAEHVAPVANRLGITILGVGILLAGAEPEEAATAVTASLRDAPALAIGDAVGANFAILTLTIGLAALVAPLPISTKVLRFGAAAVVTGIAPILVLLDGTVSRIDGSLLLTGYVVIVVWIWRTDRTPPLLGELAELDEDELTAQGTLWDLVKALGGIALMVAGGYLAVRGAEGLLEIWDMAESAVGLTVLALATSAEMLALVWSAGRRGISEVVVAGAVGCAVYNSTVSIGLAAVVRPLDVGGDVRLLAIAGAVAVLPLALHVGRREGHLDRRMGFFLVAVYLAGASTLLATG
jgi:cation:H+ antiporter